MYFVVKFHLHIEICQNVNLLEIIMKSNLYLELLPCMLTQPYADIHI